MGELVLVLVVLVAAYLGMRLVRRSLRAPLSAKAAASPPVPTFRTLLLVIPSDDILTDAVKSVLIDMWGDLPITELADRSALDLAFEFKVTFPNPGFDDATRMQIAKAIHAALLAECAPGGEPDPLTPHEPAAPTQTAADARRLLEELAEPSRSVTGTNTVLRGGIYKILKVPASNVRIRDAIVLHRCWVPGTNASGRIFAAPGVQVDITGSNADVRVIQLPWAELAERAAQQRGSDL